MDPFGEGAGKEPKMIPAELLVRVVNMCIVMNPAHTRCDVGLLDLIDIARIVAGMRFAVVFKR